MQPEGQRILHLDLCLVCNKMGRKHGVVGCSFLVVSCKLVHLACAKRKNFDEVWGSSCLQVGRKIWFLRKSPNVLCAPLWTAKLCDFGLATCFFLVDGWDGWDGCWKDFAKILLMEEIMRQLLFLNHYEQ